MRYAVIVLGSFLAGVSSAGAGSGSFAGGAAQGIQAADAIDLQRRAVELDARDGGNRYHRLRQQQQMDELRQELQKSNRLLEEFKMQQLVNPRR